MKNRLLKPSLRKRRGSEKIGFSNLEVLFGVTKLKPLLLLLIIVIITTNKHGHSKTKPILIEQLF